MKLPRSLEKRALTRFSTRAKEDLNHVAILVSRAHGDDCRRCVVVSHVGFFHDGQACSTCPEHATTADEFAASVSGCMCLPGFFMRYDAGGVPSCKMCSDLHPPGTTVGTNCTDIATTVFDIPVVEGARETRHIAMRCV